MVQSHAVATPSLGRVIKSRPLDARAGVPMELRAQDHLGEIAPGEIIIWYVDGHQVPGPTLTWTFVRPGRYRVRVETGRRSHVILVNVVLRLRDLAERRTDLDFFYC